MTSQIVHFFYVLMRRCKDVSNWSVSFTYLLQHRDDVSAWSATSRPIWGLTETSLWRRIPGGATLHEYCFESKPKEIEQKRFQIINDSMQMKSIKKSRFAGSNDKRFYFHDGIVSLPFGHFLLNNVTEEKEKHRADLHTKIQKKNVCIFSIKKSCCTFVWKIKGIKICSTTITIFIKLTSFIADKKIKIHNRTNNKWKLEISQFTMDSFAEIF